MGRHFINRMLQLTVNKVPSLRDLGNTLHLLSVGGAKRNLQLIECRPPLKRSRLCGTARTSITNIKNKNFNINIFNN
jgi:hypothetical protein